MTSPAFRSGPPPEQDQIPANSHRLQTMVDRLDLIAVLAGMVGLGVLGMVGIALAVVGLYRFMAAMWSHPFDRALMIAFALIVVWVVSRWRKLSYFS
jgi:uncharacterized membrane-anchored protein